LLLVVPIKISVESISRLALLKLSEVFLTSV